jgi:hypothetical protein
MHKFKVGVTVESKNQRVLHILPWINHFIHCHLDIFTFILLPKLNSRRNSAKKESCHTSLSSCSRAHHLIYIF